MAEEPGPRKRMRVGVSSSASGSSGFSLAWPLQGRNEGGGGDGWGGKVVRLVCESHARERHARVESGMHASHALHPSTFPSQP